MKDSSEAIARRILESVLRQLEGGAARAGLAPPVDQMGSASASGSPIIIIMLGDGRAAGGGAEVMKATGAALPVAAQAAGCGCQNNSPGGGKNSLQSLHPSLERFELLEDNALSNGPRRCVVEPDRDCVGSGACEMRGH